MSLNVRINKEAKVVLPTPPLPLTANFIVNPFRIYHIRKNLRLNITNKHLSARQEMKTPIGAHRKPRLVAAF
jgi:hypothetical protein